MVTPLPFHRDRNPSCLTTEDKALKSDGVRGSCLTTASPCTCKNLASVTQRADSTVIGRRHEKSEHAATNFQEDTSLGALQLEKPCLQEDRQASERCGGGFRYGASKTTGQQHF